MNTTHVAFRILATVSEAAKGYFGEYNEAVILHLFKYLLIRLTI